MAKRQNRRSVSLKAHVYARLFNYAQRTGQPAATVVEMALRQYLSARHEPYVPFQSVRRVPDEL